MDRYLAGGPDEPQVRAVLEVLEAEFGADHQVDELIAVSFLEQLPYPGQPGAELVTLLGPRLRVELDRLRGPA